jgi:hypothetical protein
MIQNEEIEIQLWEYIDGTCTGVDKQRIAALISNDEVWQQKYKELSAFNTSVLEHMPLEQPSMRFSKNVMEAVSHVKIAPATKKYINSAVIKGIAATFIISITCLMGYALTHADWSDSSKPRALSKFYPIANFDFNSLFSNDLFNIVLVINILLGLLLIDTVLRRKRTHHIS